MPEAILEPNCAYSQTVSSPFGNCDPGVISREAPHRRTSRQSYRMPAAPVNWRSVAPLHRLDVTGIKSQVLCRTVLGVGKTITRQAQRNSEKKHKLFKTVVILLPWGGGPTYGWLFHSFTVLQGV